ncbi:GNAT family N-acetyltransferase [Pseudonocardia sp.]|uniref:GNAT family N-acetyltransferase n=1 Tax=Pseudonocardia sp. TaxID=60912 RepID=UPI002631E635|nr:GNAT family N-acetyltransferase [Pseudonocardia sp.]MCW2718692.1 family N-acetyltransferase [Pseudonocardia sp.]
MDDPRLTAHLLSWLGRWPGAGPGLTVVGSPKRVEPGWDGLVHAVIGVTPPEGGVLSVPPAAEPAVAAAIAAGDDGSCVPAAAKIDGGFFRWLRPFGHDVLVAVDPDTGEHLAGVGIKRHDEHGHELSVVTAAAARGMGLARRLVAQAARRVLDEGAVPTYLHAHSNVGSAKVAEASGFPNLGWSILGVAN